MIQKHYNMGEINRFVTKIVYFVRFLDDQKKRNLQLHE